MLRSGSGSGERKEESLQRGRLGPANHFRVTSQTRNACRWRCDVQPDHRDTAWYQVLPGPACVSFIYISPAPGDKLSEAIRYRITGHDAFFQAGPESTPSRSAIAARLASNNNSSLLTSTSHISLPTAYRTNSVPDMANMAKLTVLMCRHPCRSISIPS